MDALILRTGKSANLTAAQVDGNFTKVKAAVDAVETSLAQLLALVGPDAPDSDTFVSTVRELLTMAVNFPEGVNLIAKLNAMQSQINTALANVGNGSGTPGTGSAITDLDVQVNEEKIDRTPIYAADGVTILGYMIDPKDSWAENVFRRFVAGTSTTSPDGTSVNNPVQPQGHSFPFLGRQTFVAPYGLTADDIETAISTNPSVYTPYGSPIVVPGATPKGRFIGRIKAIPGRAVSALTGSEEFPAMGTPVNFIKQSSNISVAAGWGKANGELDNSAAPGLDGNNTALQGRSYGGLAISSPLSDGNGAITDGDIICYSAQLRYDKTAVPSIRVYTYDGRVGATFDTNTLQNVESNAFVKAARLEDMSSLGGDYVNTYLVEVAFQITGNATSVTIQFNGIYSQIFFDQPALNPGLRRTTYLATTV